MIPDYVSRPTQGGFDGTEEELCAQGGTKLFLRTSRQKPAVENITLAQWVSANAPIMAKLIDDDVLNSREKLLDYLQYVQDFGDFAQVCEHNSLMIYDQEFRKKQATKGSSWAVSDVHLSTFYLHRRQRAAPAGQQHRNPRTNTPPRLLDNEGKEICRNFNSNTCQRENCRFSHVCSLCKVP